MKEKFDLPNCSIVLDAVLSSIEPFAVLLHLNKTFEVAKIQTLFVYFTASRTSGGKDEILIDQKCFSSIDHDRKKF